jgi:hypothetical protein
MIEVMVITTIVEPVEGNQQKLFCMFLKKWVGSLVAPLIVEVLTSLISLYLFLKERTKEKNFLTLKIPQKPPFKLPLNQDSALVFFKLTTIGGI